MQPFAGPVMAFHLRTAIWVGCAGLLALPAIADERRAAREASQHRLAGERPIKDCTRHNARAGYYANPWCTPEEQDRWDRWEARRLTGR